MSIPVSNSTAPAAAAAEPARQKDAPAPAAQMRAQLNSAIVQAALSVSISAQSAPLALVFKSALTGINEALKAQYGPDAVQQALSQDNTPQGTADRIVALSTGFFDAFKRQHPGEDESALLAQFMGAIRGGVETGFKEARGILQGLNVLSGDVAANVDQTYALVQKGYADFEAAHGKAANSEAAPDAPAAA